MAVPDNIVLGDGTFAVGGTTIALTRGGGSFSVEREYRMIDADGDYGPVKGRIRKIGSTARLTMNALEIVPANLTKFHPAMDIDTTSVAGTSTITGSSDVVAGDYSSEVTWTGKTKAGKAVTITLENAINLENLDWALVDKEEIIPELTFTACYLSSDRTTEPWKIDYVTA